MLMLIAACLLHSPAWVTELSMTPPPANAPTLKGPADAPELVVVPSGRKTSLTVTGPGVLRVQAAALLKKKGAKHTAPGRLLIWVGSVQRRTLTLVGDPQAGWFVVGRNNWAVGQTAELDIPLTDGPQKISISHQQGGAGFYALIASLRPAADPLAEAPAASPSVDGPPPPPPPPPDPTDELGSALAAAGIELDDGPALLEAPVDVPPPPLAAAPQAPPGLRLPESGARTHVIGPEGTAEFFAVAIEPPFGFAAAGPGQVLLDVHVHREPAAPETQAPIIIGVLLDDVLVQTVALDQPIDARWHLASGDSQLSGRAVIRLPVPVGEHRVAISLSDNATRGASVRPRFVAAGVADEPAVLDLGTARRGDLRATDRQAAQFGITAVGGLWIPNATTSTGGAAQLALGWSMPLVGSRLWIELQSGLSQAAASRLVPVENFPSGRSRLRLSTRTVPVVATATWSTPMPVSWIGIDVGVGGGALLTWNTERFAGASEATGLRLVPALAALGGMSVTVGPGSLLLRAQLLAGLPWSAAGYRSFESGSVALVTGYRLPLN